MINSNNTYIYLKITFSVFICDVVLIQTCFLFSKIVFFMKCIKIIGIL